MKASMSWVLLSSHGLYEQESIFETVTPGVVDQELKRLLDRLLKT